VSLLTETLPLFVYFSKFVTILSNRPYRGISSFVTLNVQYSCDMSNKVWNVS